VIFLTPGPLSIQWRGGEKAVGKSPLRVWRGPGVGITSGHPPNKSLEKIRKETMADS
jgi:hypothetical protein